MGCFPEMYNNPIVPVGVTGYLRLILSFWYSDDIFFTKC